MLIARATAFGKLTDVFQELFELSLAYRSLSDRAEREELNQEFSTRREKAVMLLREISNERRAEPEDDVLCAVERPREAGDSQGPCDLLTPEQLDSYADRLRSATPQDFISDYADMLDRVLIDLDREIAAAGFE